MSEPDTRRAGTRSRWWITALAALLIAAAGFAIGRFSTFGPPEALPPGDSSAEAGFARDMQAHHAQAIEMAMEIHRKTADDEVRALAYDIATGQAAQRGEMYDWLVQWGLPQAGGPTMQWMATADDGHAHGGGATLSDEDANAAMGMATDADLRMLREAEGTAADCLFLGLMIRHHEGAIPMAEAVIDLGSEPRVLAVARSMAAGQSAEIAAMEAMRERLGCTG